MSATKKQLHESPWFWLSVLLAIGLVLPFVPVPSRAAAVAGSALLTVVYVVAVVQFVVLATRLRWTPEQAIPWLLISLAIWALLDFIVAPAVGRMLLGLNAVNQAPRPDQLLLYFGSSTIEDLALLCAAAAAGSLLARLIPEPNMLGPICAVVALIDIWGVLFGGIVSQLMEKAPELSARAMAAPPTIGAATASSAQFSVPMPSVGVGDFLFLGLLFAALHALHMNWRGAVKLTTPLIIIALFGTTFLPDSVPALPGLLFIGLGVALPNLSYFKFNRDEKFALLYAALFVVLLTVALFFGVTSMLPSGGGSTE